MNFENNVHLSVKTKRGSLAFHARAYDSRKNLLHEIAKVVVIINVLLGVKVVW